ncbi:DMT family transporter [Lactobacillus sp. 3B(2020)]|uniref:DMT family transporter n=1 Tax=Lactobacillus sp. 3B(2020) TaxID=2695882 RepID=UPI0015DDC731|nr:DMT family transporter [Lactobacillus sp. 3B(2020)]QLL70851.1 EamA family transporter [Lactobacillus sp. 3B(2020)]
MSKQAKGIFLAAVGAMMWGGSGAAAQYLFHDTPLTTNWLVAVRMLGAGIILTLISLFRNPQGVKRLLTQKWSLIQLVAFAIFGTLNSQLTYFLAIRYSNAPTATVIQYLQPVIIIIWLALVNQHWPRRIDDISVVLAILGTFLLVTGGRLGSLTLTPIALFWGLWCAVAAAIYTVMPVKLLKEFDTFAVCGLAMLIGGLIMSPELFITHVPHLTTADWGMVGYVVIFGTMAAYSMFLGSLNFISPTTTGILGAFEPLVATIIAVSFLGTKLTTAMVIGSLLILATTFLQAIPVKKNPLAK